MVKIVFRTDPLLRVLFSFLPPFWKMYSSNLFEGLIFCLACSVHFVRRRFWATSLGFCRNRPESSADKMYRACETKDQTLKKIRTLYCPDPFSGHPSSSPFSRHFFTLFSPSKSALFYRVNCTAHSLERGSFRTHVSTKFGKEIPSRNPRAKRSENDWKAPVATSTLGRKNTLRLSTNISQTKNLTFKSPTLLLIKPVLRDILTDLRATSVSFLRNHAR